MNEKTSYVYILSNNTFTTFYTGVTCEIQKRMYQHDTGQIDGFTKQYNVKKLLYYEIYSDISLAIAREKKIKHWKKEWKWNLIERLNPERKNLYINGAVLPLDN